MANISIKTDVEALNLFLRGYSRRSRAAVARAMNKIAREARPVVKEDMKAQPLQSTWRPRGIAIVPATAARRITTLTSRGTPDELLLKPRRFNAHHTKPSAIWMRVGKRRYPIRLLFLRSEGQAITTEWQNAVDRTMRNRWPQIAKEELWKAAKQAKQAALRRAIKSAAKKAGS